MKKYLIYSLFIIGIISLVIIYLSVIGIETKKFNNQIQNKVVKINSKLDLKLKKIKLTLDPLNFRINAKTIGSKILYQQEIIELEYIKTQISLISLIKNKFISSNLEISTRSISLKNLAKFARTISNRHELFFLERLIKNGHVILDIRLNIDENGNIKNDYEIIGLLKDGKIDLLKNRNFENINFILNIKNNIFNFRDINFKTGKMNFFSENLKVTKSKKELFFKGVVENKKSYLSTELLDLFALNLKDINLENINFSSKNNFSFNINNRFKFKNLTLASEIQIDEFEHPKPHFFNNYFPNIKDMIYLKDHKIKAKYKKNELTIKGSGKIQIEKEFDKIEYLITNKDKVLNLVADVSLNELSIKSHVFLRNFFPEIKDIINLKNHKINISYNKNNLSLSGLGKIKIEKEFDKIDYSISNINKKLNFASKIDLEKTALNINHLNYIKDKKLKTQVEIMGSYEKNNRLTFNKISLIEKKNKILLKDLILDKENKIIKIDEINLDYFDSENKKNNFLIKRKQKNNYELNGQILNANSLISNLLKSKDSKNPRIFKHNINLTLNLAEVFIDKMNVVKNLKGKLYSENNKIVEANIVAFFDNGENFTFTIKTNGENEKITTLYSSRAKPLVKRYKFIKGYEEGYLDFYSIKKDKISNSRLKINDFKLQELPTLTKLLTLASLQGIADILSGEGIRFDEFEMKFSNKGKLMTIDEIYAIGPAISILMNGYVEQDKLISLRGTLVPATTINKSIGSIPLLGKILVGDKTGEGVFGVSFKIKGPPKNLETTVNPIKTLTPRFITRTLEKIKKN